MRTTKTSGTMGTHHFLIAEFGLRIAELDLSVVRGPLQLTTDHWQLATRIATSIFVFSAVVAGALLYLDLVRLVPVGAAFFRSMVVFGFALLDERIQVLGNVKSIGHGGYLDG